VSPALTLGLILNQDKYYQKGNNFQAQFFFSDGKNINELAKPKKLNRSFKLLF